MRAQPLLLHTENARSQGVSLRLSLPPPHFGIFAPANDQSLTELAALMGKAPSIQTLTDAFVVLRQMFSGAYLPLSF